jgi:hypothetical protein
LDYVVVCPSDPGGFDLLGDDPGSQLAQNEGSIDFELEVGERELGERQVDPQEDFDLCLLVVDQVDFSVGEEVRKESVVSDAQALFELIQTLILIILKIKHFGYNLP